MAWKLPPAPSVVNILWLSHLVPYPPQGGAAQRSYHLLREAARRHAVSLVALNQRALLPLTAEVAAAAAHLGEWCRSVRVFAIPWDRSAAHRRVLAAASIVSGMPYEVSWLASQSMHAFVRALAASERFDMVHVDTLGLMPYARHFRGAPLMLTHHDVESHLAGRRADAEASRLRRWFFRNEARKIERVLRTTCPEVALNVAVSELDAARLLHVAPGSRTHVVDNGVDIDYFRPSGDGEVGERSLVFAGSLDCYPNEDAVRHFLDEIWPALLASDPDRRAAIVGRNPPPGVQAAAARDPRLTVTGRVADVRPYLEAAAIYVCPLRVGGGTRLKVLDALAMTKPLVATTLAVEGLDLEPERHYLPAQSPAEFVAQITRLERDGALRRSLGRAGRELVERRYSWQVIGERLEAAYRRATDAALTLASPIPSATSA